MYHTGKMDACEETHSFMYARERVSANIISLPGLYCSVNEYFCNCRNILCNLGGVVARDFFRIASSGLWSDSTMTSLLHTYW